MAPVSCCTWTCSAPKRLVSRKLPRYARPIPQESLLHLFASPVGGRNATCCSLQFLVSAVAWPRMSIDWPVPSAVILLVDGPIHLVALNGPIARGKER
jgi:hypothetical protein